ncbi:biotin-dependent 3-methylcrotonyl-coenzyme A carboxylase beta1 subunit-like [Petromyzon marinus]|uniref:biotin-dependent 3-methylcrotonyl-coenzyme A carboxylase beta1 subunit-like n=1 Tax=Petromyzon marinus TaxID=7757 RepID=UPI003F70D65A
MIVVAVTASRRLPGSRWPLAVGLAVSGGVGGVSGGVGAVRGGVSGGVRDCGGVRRVSGVGRECAIGGVSRVRGCVRGVSGVSGGGGAGGGGGGGGGGEGVEEVRGQGGRVGGGVSGGSRVLDGSVSPALRHVYEANLRRSLGMEDRMQGALSRVRTASSADAIARHTQRNKKLLARDRLSLLLDPPWSPGTPHTSPQGPLGALSLQGVSPFLELSPMAGMDLPEGDVPGAGCITGVGRVAGSWCVVVVNDATVKGGSMYPIAVKKQLRAQEVAHMNRLPCIYLVDSAGAFLPLQAKIFPDREDGGRVFYNEAVMNAVGIPQVAVVLGSCTAGGAYVPTMAGEAVMVGGVGSLYLGGPPLVRATTGERVTPEELGGARMHASVSGCIDHFSETEQEALELTRNIVSTLTPENPPSEPGTHWEEPLFSAAGLRGLAPKSFSHNLDPRLVLSRILDGSRFLEFKSLYGDTLVTGIGDIMGVRVGVVANHGFLSARAALKGSHFVSLCEQRGIPLIFLQNTAPTGSRPDMDTEEIVRSRGAMMASVACVSVPKITVVIGGRYGTSSYAMCGRAFSPRFLFLWPGAITRMESEQKKLGDETSSLYSTARIWDDGVILPQDTRTVLGWCLRIVSKQRQPLPISPMPPIRFG